MTTFLITTRVPAQHEEAVGDLRIDPATYRAQLVERWPHTQFKEAPGFPLQWILYTRSEEGVEVAQGIGKLHNDLQTVTVDTPYEEFFLWHREVVPPRQRLFLYDLSSMRSLELTVDITFQTVEEFCEGRSNAAGRP
jgi:hypothetical protein